MDSPEGTGVIAGTMFLVCVVILQLFFARDSTDKVGHSSKLQFLFPAFSFHGCGVHYTGCAPKHKKTICTYLETSGGFVLDVRSRFLSRRLALPGLIFRAVLQ